MGSFGIGSRAMRRTALVLAALALGAGLLVAAGCGGEEEATPTPDTITGTVTTTDTETTDETETDTTDETETDGGGEGDPAAGKEVFTTNCASCHTLADAGSTGTIGPNLDESQPSMELVVERVTNGAGVMPSFADTLSEQQITDVAAYVSTSAG
jgi:mono/diheme cytochrome c family protein